MIDLAVYGIKDVNSLRLSQTACFLEDGEGNQYIRKQSESFSQLQRKKFFPILSSQIERLLKKCVRIVKRNDKAW